MNVQEAIHSRRTAHKWAETRVPYEVLERGLQAAQMAPCHRHTWPWRFTLPGDVARQALFEVGVGLKAKKLVNTAPETLRRRLHGKLLTPALVVVSQVLDADPFREKEDYAACACAIQNFCLSVTGDGYQSKWSTGALTTDSATYKILALREEVERIVGFVWVGKPDHETEAPPRPELDSVLRSIP